jgi:hypothetical protein
MPINGTSNRKLGRAGVRREKCACKVVRATAYSLLRSARVLIRIARLLRVTLSDTDLQTLRPGEFYDVPPAVGYVLVSEGWAVDAALEMRDASSTRAQDDPSDRSTS